MAKSADDAPDAKAEADATPSTTTSTSSAARSKRSGDPRRRAAVKDAEEAAEAKSRHKVKAQQIGNPGWFVPVMLGLMLIGLVWVVTFYITQEQYPIESWGRWNLGAGFALMMAGFAMTTRWK